jgi:hypothetical protein
MVLTEAEYDRLLGFLSGERRIDRAQADLLGDRFGVSAGLFGVEG